MKTINLKTGKRSSIILAIVFLVSVSAFADGDRNSACKNTNTNNENTTLKEMVNPIMAESLSMSPAPVMSWMVEEIEEELKVEDLETGYNMRPLWNVEAIDIELAVEDYKATEEVIPYWLIVEEEAELEVTDLVLE